MQSGVQTVRRDSRRKLVALFVRVAWIPTVVFVSTMLVLNRATIAKWEAGFDTLVLSNPEAAPMVARIQAHMSQTGAAMVTLGLLSMALVGFGASRLASRMAYALSELQLAASRMAEGDLETDIVVEGCREVEDLADSLRRMRVGLRDHVALTLEATRLRRERAVVEAARALFSPERQTYFEDGLVLEVGSDAEAVSDHVLWQRAKLGDGSLLVLYGECATGGTRAALVSAVVNTCVRVMVRRGSTDLRRLLADIHAGLGGAGGEDGEVSVQALRIRAGDDTFDLVSAGGAGVRLGDGAQEPLGAGGLPLGGARFEIVSGEPHRLAGQRMVLGGGVPDQGGFSLTVARQEAA